MGRRIRKARVYWAKTIDGSTPRQFTEAVAGRKILGIGRRGKYIVVTLDASLYLLIHLRMSGRLQLGFSESRQSRHVQAVLDLDDRRALKFHDPRKFGRICLTGTPRKILDRLGPEPLSGKFSARWLARQLDGRRRQIKPLMLDQTFLAGLGNIYVDEALWAAAIHPMRKADTLSHQEIASLHRAIRRILRNAIHNGGTSLGTGQGNFAAPDSKPGQNLGKLKVFRRTGADCPRCGKALIRIKVAQRSSHICPRCQRK